MENPIKMDDLRGKPTIFGNIQLGHTLSGDMNYSPGSTNILVASWKMDPDWVDVSPNKHMETSHVL